MARSVNPAKQARQSAAHDAAKRNALAEGMGLVTPLGVSVGTSTGDAMTKEPIAKTSELLGAESAHKASAAAFNDAVQELSSSTEDAGSESIDRILGYWILFDSNDKQTIEDGLDPKTFGYQRNTTAYIYQQNAKKFYNCWKADGTVATREANLSKLTAEKVIVRMTKDSEPRALAGWNARMKKADEINAEIRNIKARDAAAAQAAAEMLKAGVSITTEALRDAADAILETKQEERDEDKADRETAESKAKATVKRELGDKGRGIYWLADYAKALAVEVDAAIVAHNSAVETAAAVKAAAEAAGITSEPATTH